ncbi:peptidase, partial [Burkholderia pseudomallei]
VVAPAEQAAKTGQFRPGAGAVTLASPAFHAKKADAAAKAREYVTARAAQLGLDKAALATLVVASERADTAFTVVRIQQRAAGLPVYDSDIAVTVAPDGRV